MNKKIFFMSGLPRSGNTLLACILNQNPKIKVTANSLVSDILYNLESLKYGDIFKNFPDENSLNNLISNVFNLYYEKWDCEYIIDRGPWGTPGNLNTLKKYFNDIKIISPVRNVLEVISSMYKYKDYELTSTIQQWIQSGWRIPCDKNIEELKCELLMEKDSMIEKNLFAVRNLSLPENKKFTKFVEYDYLVKYTEKTVKQIYDFLEIDYFNHDYNNINQFKVNGISYNDSIVTNLKDFHSVNSSIKKSNTSINFLNKKIISRYSNLEYWRN